MTELELHSEITALDLITIYTTYLAFLNSAPSTLHHSPLIRACVTRSGSRAPEQLFDILSRKLAIWPSEAAARFGFGRRRLRRRRVRFA